MEATNPRVDSDIGEAFHLTPGAPLDVARLQAELLAFPVLTEETAIWLTPGGVGDTVSFRVVIERPHVLMVGLGVAYDYDQGGRLWVGTGGRQHLLGSLTAWSLLAADRFEQSLSFGALHSTLWRRGILSLGMNVRGTNERVRVFDTAGVEGASLETRELLGFAGVEPQLSARWEGALGLEARTWSEPGRTATGVGALVRLHQVDATGIPLVHIEANHTGVYQRVSAVGELHGRLLTRGRFEAIPFWRYGWGEDLPLQSTFPLGGSDGFPGLALGERRGSREVLTGLRFLYSLGSGMFAEASAQGGTTAGEGGAVPDSMWVWGGRLGIRIETQLGGLRIAYGHNSLGRGSAFVRVGSWW